MEHHLTRKVILSEDSKYKNLYNWFLREVGNDDKELGREQIPWNWTLYFSLSDIAIFSSLESDRYSERDNNDKLEMHQREFIRASLSSDYARDYAATSYSMFGTDRSVSDFKLYIYPVGDGEEENCVAWGAVSYTTDIDFRNVTADDVVVFYLHLTAERFAHYVQIITERTLTKGNFLVGDVEGFYSDWSPGITTSQIKILTGHTKDHPVEIPEGCSIVPPRLGKVGEFELSLASEIKFLLPYTAEISDIYKDEEGDAPPKRSSGQGLSSKFLPIADQATIKLLSSLRVAAWTIVILLLMVVLIK